MRIEDFLNRLKDVRRVGSGWMARCPAHDDRKASLSVTEGGKQPIVVKCHAGCSTTSIMAALRLKVSELSAPRPEVNSHIKPRIVAVYRYQDETGKVLYEINKYEPKDFKQRRPDPDRPSEWLWNLDGVERVLYRLPETIEAVKAGRAIFVVEGEKDVHALVDAGFAATCNPMGAGKWRPEYTKTLTGAASVCVIADNDEPGRKHALAVATALHGVAKRVKLVELPDHGGKPVKDAADFFAAGGSADELRDIVEAAPEFVSASEQSEPAPAGSNAPGCANPSESSADRGDQELIDRYGEPLFFRGGTGEVVSINERFFAGHFNRESRVLWEPKERAFYQYSPDTGLWQPASDDHLREMLAAHLLNFGRKTQFALESKLTTARMGAIVQALRGISEKRDAFARRGDFVHVANGVIRFNAGSRVVLTDFDPDDYSRNRCPIPFVSDADCPRFLNEFLRVALSDADICLLQRLSGLAVAGINPAQRFTILDGAAATGKSTVARLLQKLVGVENCAQLRTDLLCERFEVFRFVGKTLLLAPDTPGDFLSRPSASTLKALTGGDPLNAEAKGSNAGFPLTGNFNVLITSNSRLRVRLDGDAGAWQRRLIIIRFDKKPPPRRIPNFADLLLQEEGPGILRWCLAGFVRAREEIQATGDLYLTPEQQMRVEALLCESDSVRRFVLECTANGDGDVTSDELVEAYFRFCAEREWTPQPSQNVRRTLIDAMLELRGASQCHNIRRDGNSHRGWRGAKLRQQTEHSNAAETLF
jgi:P4 family phage/plasmid primase-like protien